MFRNTVYIYIYMDQGRTGLSYLNIYRYVGVEPLKLLLYIRTCDILIRYTFFVIIRLEKKIRDLQSLI